MLVDTALFESTQMPTIDNVHVVLAYPAKHELVQCWYCPLFGKTPTRTEPICNKTARYCLMGSTKKYLELIKQHKGEDAATSSNEVLEDPWLQHLLVTAPGHRCQLKLKSTGSQVDESSDRTTGYLLDSPGASHLLERQGAPKDFKAKYMPFFVEDYRRWTQQGGSVNH